MLLRLGLVMQLALMFIPVEGGFAQDSAVGRLPKDTGAVVWTLNFPAFEQRLRDERLHPFVELRETFESIQDRIGNGELSLSEWQRKQLETWTAANDNVIAAFDNRLFPGEVTISIRETADQQACVTLIARTDGNKEDLQSLASALKLLFTIKNSDWYAPIAQPEFSDRENASAKLREQQRLEKGQEDEVEVGPTWTLQDGWFVWSNLGGQPKRILESINSGDAENQLISIREFQSLSMRFAEITDNEGGIRFYLSPEWMGSVASRIDYERLPYPFNAIFYPFDGLKKSPRAVGLDQIRSLGGRISLGQDTRLQTTRTLFTVDAFLLTAAPAKGLLKPIHAQQGFHFAPPLPPGELGLFGQIQVQGDELVDAVSESVRKSFSAVTSEESIDSEKAISEWRQNYGLVFDWPNRLSDQLDAVAILAMNPKVCSPRNYLHPYQMLHFRESATLSDDVQDFLSSRVPTTAGPSDTRLELVNSNESMEWRIPSDSIESYLKSDFIALLEEFYAKELAIRRQKYAEIKPPAEVDRLVREFQQEMKEAIERSIDATRVRLSQLTFFVENGWVPLIPYDREQERHGGSTGKLQRLKQTVAEANASLDFSSKPAILLSFWAYEHLYNTTPWPTEERSDAALSLSSLRSKRRLDIDAAPSLRNLGNTRFIQRFDSLLLLSSRDRNGFEIRIVGVAVGDDQ